MKSSVDVDRVGNRSEEQRAKELAPAPRTASPGARVPALDRERCSVDPLRRTDRYRLVTPYFDSSRDL